MVPESRQVERLEDEDKLSGWKRRTEKKKFENTSSTWSNLIWRHKEISSAREIGEDVFFHEKTPSSASVNACCFLLTEFFIHPIHTLRARLHDSLSTLISFQLFQLHKIVTRNRIPRIVRSLMTACCKWRWRNLPIIFLIINRQWGLFRDAAWKERWRAGLKSTSRYAGYAAVMYIFAFYKCWRDIMRPECTNVDGY